MDPKQECQLTAAMSPIQTYHSIGSPDHQKKYAICAYVCVYMHIHTAHIKVHIPTKSDATILHKVHPRTSNPGPCESNYGRVMGLRT